VGAEKNSMISSPWKVVSCFAMMFVPLWKFLAMNITWNSGAFSLICQSELEGGSTPQWK